MEGGKAADLQILVQGAQQELDHCDQRLLDDEVLRRRKRPKVVIEPIPEESMDNVEVVLVALILSDGRRLPSSLRSFDHLFLILMLYFIINWHAGTHTIIILEI